MAVIVHLTARAYSWALGGRHTKLPVGLPACGKPKEKGSTRFDYCGTEDVRAMVRGWQYAYRYKHYPDSLMRDPVTHPTCPECQVLLDQALETTKQGSVPDQLMDATEASYEAYKEREDDRDDDFGFDEPHW